MPLYGRHPALRVIQRVDRPVLGHCSHHQPVGDPGHGLVVAGGNLDRDSFRTAAVPVPLTDRLTDEVPRVSDKLAT